MPYTGATNASGRARVGTHGPFVDSVGQSIWVDEFDVLSFVAIQRSGAAEAFLYILIPPGVVLTDAIALEPGSVWIPAGTLAAGAPTSAFVGLRIKSGNVSFGSVLDVSRSPIVVPPDATVTLELEHDVPPAPTGAGPGEDARQAHVRVPLHATFAFTPAGATLTALDEAALQVFGTTASLQPDATTATFDQLLGRIAVIMQPDRDRFAISDCRSTLVTLSGSAPMVSASWSLPITIAPSNTLGSAAGAGGVAFAFGPGLVMTWLGHATPTTCNAGELVVEPGTIALVDVSAFTADVALDIALWNHAAPRAHGALAIRFPHRFGFAFVVDATGNETLGIVTSCTANLDRPLTVNGARLPLSSPSALVVFGQNPLGPYLYVSFGMFRGFEGALAFAIKNLVLETNLPDEFVLFAAYVAGACPLGSLAVQFRLHFGVPILPDPYVTSGPLDPDASPGSGPPGALTMFVSWLVDAVPVIDVALPSTASAIAAPSRALPAAVESDVVLASDHGRAARASLPAPPDASTGGIALVDVSTNVSQFGVAFGGTPQHETTTSIADLFLQTQGSDLYVMTLPVVQWEPVLSPDDSVFPSPLSFDDCGNATSFVADSVELVPIAPRPAIDALVERYNRANGPAEVDVRFTLPFGIVAYARLARSTTPNLLSPMLLGVAPSFTSAQLVGGDQLSLRAPGSWLDPGDREASPTFAGFAMQLHNARLNGSPVTQTVLTPIDETFNANFGPSAPSPRVPLTRIDVSGFGASTFSDWRNPDDTAAAISKVRFDVLVGRTSLEVVQVYSLLYPYAVRVVRTITIERQNGASVVRHDSGWQALSDGAYRYPKPDLVTHPGVVPGARDVVNIRDTGQRITTSDSSELMAVRFDCRLTMENVTRGAGERGIDARDQLGYVQLSDPPGNGQLARAQYAELLAAAGPLGGAVDCEIDIGASGQRMRVLRVGIAATQGTSGPEFAMAAWGSPILPAGGQWSFLREASAGDVPQPVDRDLGVPLVRAGPPGTQSTAPWRFADPADVLLPDNPAADYGIIHVTGTQRTLFPRPKIEAASTAITSTRAPLFADPFLMGTAVGFFPRADFALSFPDSSYALRILPGTHLRLERAAASFTLPSPERVLHDSQAVRTRVVYGDENGHGSLVSIAIDTSADTTWSIEMTNVSFVSGSASLGEVTRVVSRLAASSKQTSAYPDARLAFGPCLKPVQHAVTFLEHFGVMPPLSVALTNKASHKESLKVNGEFDFAKWIGLVTDPGVKELLETFIADADFKFTLAQTPDSSDVEYEFELVVKIPIFAGASEPVKPVAIGIAAVTIKEVSDFGEVYAVKIGVGIGVDFELGPFDALAYYAQTATLVRNKDVFGLVAAVIIKGNVDLELLEIDVSAEGAMALLSIDCNRGADTTLWGVAQLTFALDVTVCWVVDIDFEEKIEWDSNFDGGVCPLPDVV
ncbi:MAG TPA: hypothetical protein VGI14_21260 [Casimicrobiaceae bacterium]